MSMPTCNVPFLVLPQIRPIPLAAAEHALYQKIVDCVSPMPVMHRHLRSGLSRTAPGAGKGNTPPEDIERQAENHERCAGHFEDCDMFRKSQIGADEANDGHQ